MGTIPKGMKLETALARVRELIAMRGGALALAGEDVSLITVEAPFPRLFGELVRVQAFQAFDVGSIRMYSNIPSELDNLNELHADKKLRAPLLEAGFAPFGRPTTGSYDRVCFDVRGKLRGFDAPIVIMDHEAVLSFGRIPRPRWVAGGLLELMEITV